MIYEGRNKQPMIATKPIKMRRKDNKRFDEIERALCRNRDIKPIREVELREATINKEPHF